MIGKINSSSIEDGTVLSTNQQIQWLRKKSLFHGSLAFLFMNEITKIENTTDAPIVIQYAARQLKLEFATMAEKDEFYDCFPLIVEGIEKA